MLQATLFHYPSGGNYNDFVYQIIGQAARYFRASDLAALIGFSPKRGELTELIRLDPSTNIPGGLIFVKTTTGILLLTRNGENLDIILERPAETARSGKILEVTSLLIPNLSVDETRKQKYSSKGQYSIAGDDTTDKLRDLRNYQLTLSDFNSPIVDILRNVKIQKLNFEDLANRMSTGEIVNYHIYPYKDSAGNNIGVFIDRNGPIYLVKLRYDNTTNQISPPV